jgi:hypothetical protein
LREATRARLGLATLSMSQLLQSGSRLAGRTIAARLRPARPAADHHRGGPDNILGRRKRIFVISSTSHGRAGVQVAITSGASGSGSDRGHLR